MIKIPLKGECPRSSIKYIWPNDPISHASFAGKRDKITNRYRYKKANVMDVMDVSHLDTELGPGLDTRLPTASERTGIQSSIRTIQIQCCQLDSIWRFPYSNFRAVGFTLCKYIYFNNVFDLLNERIHRHREVEKLWSLFYSRKSDNPLWVTLKWRLLGLVVRLNEIHGKLKQEYYLPYYTILN